MVQASRKPIIGLAGGIGSGKSAVAKILADLGCVVSDSDAAAREALQDSTIKHTILEWWGKGTLDQTGAINRRAVAKIVFGDPVERQRLEQLTHPWIEARRLELFAQPASPSVRAFVIDAPLLYEAGLDAQCDAVIFVNADRETRLERVMKTRGWDAAELTKREQSQLPLDAKRNRAHYVVQNIDGDWGGLKEQVTKVLNHILETFPARRK